ncbi:MAG: DUF5678 domain-containing protein [Chloroflexota bacterium]
MDVIPIQVTQQGVLIPLAYFEESENLELVIRDGFAVVRRKSKSPTFPAHKRQAEMMQEVQAFEAQHTMLADNYLGQYVAFYQGTLIDHDANHIQLVKRIDAKYPNEIVLIRQVQEKLPQPLRGPTPRLVSR